MSRAKVEKSGRLLKARYVVPFRHPEGEGDAVMMVEERGGIYLRTVEGWVPMDMKEAPPNDTTL